MNVWLNCYKYNLQHSLTSFGSVAAAAAAAGSNGCVEVVPILI